MRPSKRQPPARWEGGVLYVGGAPKLSVPTRQQWAPPYVGLPFPQIPVPAFPHAQLSPATPGPAPSTPMNPAVPGPPDPLVIEAQAVANALKFEAQGMAWVPESNAPTHTEVTITPYYQKAAAQWTVARDASAQIYFAESSLPGPGGGGASIKGQNAKFRSTAYENRRAIDQNIADGKSQRPAPGFAWAPIYQIPDPNAGTPIIPPGSFTPVPDPGTGPEGTPAPQGGSTGLFAVGIGLLAVVAAVVYAGSRAGRRAPA